MLRLLLLLALAPLAAAQPAGDLLIRGATVLTVTNGTLENTDVLVRNGRIAEIGQGLRAPAGVRVVEAAGHYLMPGIIDAHSHIALSSVNEATSPVTAEVWMGDVVNHLDIAVYRALAGGVTISHAMHGSANVIGGQNVTLKHRWGETDPDLWIMEGAPRTVKFALGENPTRVHGRGRGIRPATRMGVEQVLREAFTDALRYRQAQARAREDARAEAPRYNLRMETIASILEGDILIHAHSYRADEILMLMDVLRDFGIDHLTFQHANEAFQVAPELAAFGADVSVFSDWYDYKFEVYYSTAYNAAILTRNGVRTSINSDSAELIRHLYHEAAKAQRYGQLSDDETLALITINPAHQLGIASRVGSIEVGKDADLALFRGHPLSTYTIPVMTVVDGVVRFDRDADPDDMRLVVDPAQPVDTAMMLHDHESCMEGVRQAGLWWME
jgi:imidazolonepropionase-like amidohydrolase